MFYAATKAGQVLSEGQILLDQLLLPVKDAKSQDATPADRKQQVSQVGDTVSAVQQRKVRCDELAEVRRLKLQQLLQLRTCERDIDQVSTCLSDITQGFIQGGVSKNRGFTQGFIQGGGVSKTGGVTHGYTSDLLLYLLT